MSNIFHHGCPEHNNIPPVGIASLEDEFQNTCISNTDEEPSPAQNSSSHRPFLCTICVENDIPVLDRTLIPSCEHSFCLDCITSWSTISGACPNCKTKFDTLLIHRDIEGQLLPGPCTEAGHAPWRVEHVAVMQTMSWVQLREIHSAQHDIEHAFELPPRQPYDARALAMADASAAAPRIMNEELEDELEDRIWEEEEKNYAHYMRGGSRVISNRRFGQHGYIASGHMRAKAKGPQRGKRFGNSGAGSSQSHTAAGGKRNKNSQAKPTNGGGRKKKVKKNSRAGIAAAAAAKAAAEEAAKRASAAACPAEAGSSDAGSSPVSAVLTVDENE